MGKEAKSAQVLVTSTERGEKYQAMQDEDGIFVNSTEVGPAGVSAMEHAMIWAFELHTTQRKRRRQ